VTGRLQKFPTQYKQGGTRGQKSGVKPDLSEGVSNNAEMLPWLNYWEEKKGQGKVMRKILDKLRGRRKRIDVCDGEKARARCNEN